MKLVSLLLFGSCLSFSRLQFFQNHHRQRSGMRLRNTTPASTLTMTSQMLKKVCTATTCSKCFKVLTLQTGLSIKLRKSCKILVHMHTCCPHTFTLSTRFWVYHSAKSIGWSFCFNLVLLLLFCYFLFCWDFRHLDLVAFGGF